jgi:hypothetical protein
MKNVPNAIVFILDYVDNNRPDFKGDPTKVPSIRDVLIDNVTIEGSENAGRIVGLPDSPIRSLTFRNVRITAENAFVIKDADAPAFDRVIRTIKKGVAPARVRIIE